MTEIEFRWVYNFRLAYDLLYGYCTPRGYRMQGSHGRIGADSAEYVAARECHASTLLRPFGLSPRSSRRALNELYELTDAELLAELLELRGLFRQGQREARMERDRRNNDVTESVEIPLRPPSRAMSPAQLLAQVHRAQRAIQANPELYGRSVPLDDDDTDPPRVVRGAPRLTSDDDYEELPGIIREARALVREQRREAVDADYVNRRSSAGLNRKKAKVRGMPEPPKPVKPPKPKPKRRLVIGRKRPPVVED